MVSDSLEDILKHLNYCYARILIDFWVEIQWSLTFKGNVIHRCLIINSQKNIPTKEW
jgi:hypothetical protein